MQQLLHINASCSTMAGFKSRILQLRWAYLSTLPFSKHLGYMNRIFDLILGKLLVLVIFDLNLGKVLVLVTVVGYSDCDNYLEQV